MAFKENYVFVANPPLGPKPVNMICFHCHESIVTGIKYKATNRTHMLCLIMSLLGCCLCAPFLYVGRTCVARDHYCPVCESYLGRHDC